MCVLTVIGLGERGEGSPSFSSSGGSIDEVDISFLMMMLSVLTFLSLSDKLTEQGQAARLVWKDCRCIELLSYEKGKSSWNN